MMRRLGRLLLDSVTSWLDDNASRLSAALAYYTVFSMAPLLVVVVFIIGLVFGEEAARGRISGDIAGLVGPQAGETVENAIAGTARAPKTGIAATVLGIGLLIFGASTVFAELKNSLNAIWGVEARPGRVVRNLMRDRVLSFSLILGVGFILLVSLVVSAAVAALAEFMAGALPLPPWVWQMADFLISLMVTAALFAMILKILPDVVLRWRDVAEGALVTAVLFTVGKMLIAWYLGTSGVVSTFGAAGSVVAILLWVYYAASILFFGAEFTKALFLSRGRKPVPKPQAVVIGKAGG